MAEMLITEELLKALIYIHKVHVFYNYNREKTLTNIIAKYNCRDNSAVLALHASEVLSEIIDNNEKISKSEKIYNIYISNDYNKETAVDNLLSLNMYANKKIATYALDLSIALHSANID